MSRLGDSVKIESTDAVECGEAVSIKPFIAALKLYTAKSGGYKKVVKNKGGNNTVCKARVNKEYGVSYETLSSDIKSNYLQLDIEGEDIDLLKEHLDGYKMEQIGENKLFPIEVVDFMLANEEFINWLDPALIFLPTNDGEVRKLLWPIVAVHKRRTAIKKRKRSSLEEENEELHKRRTFMKTVQEAAKKNDVEAVIIGKDNFGTICTRIGIGCQTEFQAPLYPDVVKLMGQLEFAFLDNLSHALEQPTQFYESIETDDFSDEMVEIMASQVQFERFMRANLGKKYNAVKDIESKLKQLSEWATKEALQIRELKNKKVEDREVTSV